MDYKEAAGLDAKHVFQSYRRAPLMLARGKGPYVFDSEGRRYLDFITGLAVNSLGHSHPKITAAINKQAKTLAHVSNIYLTEPMLRLAQRLCGLSGMKRVFFCNSGAEANEAAIKLARKYSQNVLGKKGRAEIITMENSFHGRTIATVTATGQTVYQEGFAPLLPGVKYAKFNDIASVEKLITAKTCAIMVEPVQGEGGVIPATKQFMKGLAALRKKHGVLLIFDEVQCGLGRAGKWFAFEHYGVKPDIMTLAKPLGGGLPLGAMLSSEPLAKAFAPGSHASTFGANPIVCAAANAFLFVMESEGLVERSEKLGEYFKKRIGDAARDTGKIAEVRGMGLMLGIVIKDDAREAAGFFRDRGILINAVRQDVIRILPPLIITERHADEFVKVLKEFLLRK